jgi:hypothetical protein
LYVHLYVHLWSHCLIGPLQQADSWPTPGQPLALFLDSPLPWMNHYPHSLGSHDVLCFGAMPYTKGWSTLGPPVGTRPPYLLLGDATRDLILL